MNNHLPDTGVLEDLIAETSHSSKEEYDDHESREGDSHSRNSTVLDSSQTSLRNIQKYQCDNSPIGSLTGSSLFLSPSPSFLNVVQEIQNEQDDDTSLPGSLKYLDTIMENDEYIDTLQGKIPLAKAARIIARDRSKHGHLFGSAEIRRIRKQCYQKIICLGTSLLCVFSCFFSLRNLQSSSSGSDPSLGMITFGSLTALMWLGGIAANSIIYYTRPKWCLALSMVPIILYAGSNLYPVRYTLIPGGLVAGFGLGMLWNAEGIYMINLASTLAFVSKKPLIEIIGKFNAIIFSFYQSSHLVGNLLSSLILSDAIKWFQKDIKKDDNNVTISMYLANETMNEEVDYCGLTYYEISNRPTTQRFGDVDPRQSYVLLGVLSFLALIGCFNIVFFLEPLKTPKLAENKGLLANLSQFLKLFLNPKIWFLVPLMMYPGLSGSVTMADYTKVYITCAYGVSYIGYILMAGACFSVAGAFISGRIVHLTGRIPLFLFATIVSSASLMVMLFWQPQDNKMGVLAFVPVCLWSLGDGIQLSHLNGFLGEIYGKDLGFALSLLHICYGIGAAMGTLSSAFQWITLALKVKVTISHVWLAYFLYVVLEILVRRKKP